MLEEAINEREIRLYLDINSGKIKNKLRVVRYLISCHMEFLGAAKNGDSNPSMNAAIRQYKKQRY